jgi:methionyl-tRNA formyltransferase
MLNVHPSLIPRWRGAAPIERAIMAGDAETGVTIMRVEAGLDSGPVALAERTPIEPADDYGTLSARLAELGGGLILRALDRRAAGQLELADQDDSLATYADKIAPAERRLDPARPAAELERAVRALNPHIGAYLELDGGDRLGVSAASAQDGGLPPGQLAADGRALRLGCGEGVLRLDLVQPAGKRPMPGDAYLRGHPPPQVAGRF